MFARRAVLGALLVVLAAWLFVPAAARPAESARCPSETTAAVIAKKKVCLKAGQRCKPSLDRQYHRYGFHCHTGRLVRKQPPPPSPRLVALTPIGPPEMVFDWTTERCEDLDIPDLPARAFRDADGNVQVISAHFVNRRFVGRDLDHLGHPCETIMGSGFNPDPAAFDDREWIASTWTPDGNTVYALVHTEYQGNTHPGQCPSGLYDRCWWNAITFARSTDGGRTYVRRSPQALVATIPFRYKPDAGTYGAMMPSNIVRNDRDGYYYALLYIKEQPFEGTNQNRQCLIRTKDLADPSSWRAWSGGTAFATAFIDPYRSTDNPAAHLCRGVSPEALGDFPLGSLTYSTVARQWLLVGVAAGGFYYSLSPDLITWTPKTLFWPAEMGWTYECGDSDPVHYASLIDPSSTSRNFETSGATAYVYFTQFHYENCQQGLDRDLVRMPIAIRP
jgi:hypothetical protein